MKNQDEKQGIACQKETKTGLQKAVETGIQSFDLTGCLPDLDKAEEMSIDLMDDYWSPLDPGESKKVFFQKTDIRKVLDQQTGEAIDLECVFFMEKDPKTGAYRTISNGSRRLVGSIQANGVTAGMPLMITYKGKRKTQGGNQCDNWSIKPLVFK